MNPDDLQMAGRLGLAFLLGGLIGLERESHGQAAGLRTHMIVAVGAALITLISVRITEGASGPSDPGRVAAQIVSGIGFLGAGAILRYGMTVRGLTTAACLWTAAGIGMACGIGFWKGAVTATALTITATWVFSKFERRFLVETVVKRFVISGTDGHDMLDRVEALLEKHGIKARQFGVNKDFKEKSIQITVSATTPEDTEWEALLRELREIPGVGQVDIE